MKLKNYCIALSVLGIVACQDKKEKVEEPVSAKVHANELAQQFLITDGHIDLPYKLAEEGFMVKGQIPNLSGEIDGNFDFAKSMKGGLNAPFMSIYIPARYQEAGGAKYFADSIS